MQINAIQKDILSCIETMNGGTYTEIAKACQRSAPTVAARLGDLRAKGLVQRTRKRTAPSGRLAYVYILSEK